jgi:hypothetical protein
VLKKRPGPAAARLDASVRECRVYPFADEPQPRDLFGSRPIKLCDMREREQFLDGRLATLVVKRACAVDTVPKRARVPLRRCDE